MLTTTMSSPAVMTGKVTEDCCYSASSLDFEMRHISFFKVKKCDLLLVSVADITLNFQVILFRFSGKFR